MESQIIRPGHLTAHQTAQQLGITLSGVRKLVQRGRLQRSGGTVGQPWYAVDDVTALVLARRAKRPLIKSA
jgi:plasmid maintenance system antidote protein VapI